MITALVQFKLPQPVTRDKAQEIFMSTAPRYKEVPGLIRSIICFPRMEEQLEVSIYGNLVTMLNGSILMNGRDSLCTNMGPNLQLNISTLQ